jgi:hypothetical protein
LDQRGFGLASARANISLRRQHPFVDITLTADRFFEGERVAAGHCDL